MDYSLERPEYVGSSWLKNTQGLQFASAPPAELSSDRFLSSRNLWERIVCVVLQAQAGRFENVFRLIETAHLTADAAVAGAAVRMFCHAAPSDALIQLRTVFEHPTYDVRVEAYTGAALSCDVAVVPILLEALPSRVGDERNYVCTAVWDLLDPARDDDSELIELVDDPAAFVALAERMRQEYVARFGELTAAFHGVPLELPRLVHWIAELCRREDRIDMGGVIDDLLAIFEASTGISCQGCSTDDVAPIVPKISSVLNSFWSTQRLAHMKPGRRYFFGHEIPVC